MTGGPTEGRRETGLTDARVALVELGRLLLSLLVMVLVLAVIAGIAVLVLTNTDWGRERVRRMAVSKLEDTIKGRVRIGRIDGNLLEGVTVHALAITDSAGEPFLAVDSLHGTYTFRGLMRQRIEMDDVYLYRPVVVFDRKTNGEWNFKRLFKGEGKKDPTDTIPGFGSWVRLTDAHVIAGYMLVKSPWRPSDEKPPAEQQQDLREALAGGKRDVVIRAPGGTYQKVTELRDIHATLPLVRLADPEFAMRRVDVAALRMVALPFHPPAAQVRDARGTFEFDGDSAWWVGLRAQLPNSEMIADGRFVFKGDDLALRGRARRASFADLRWAYPRFPSSGGGSADFVIRLSDDANTYQLRDSDIRVEGSHLRGDLGLTFVDIGADDTLMIHDTNLRFTQLDTRLLEQLIEDFESPIRARLTGRTKIAGGLHAMRLADADITVQHAPTGTSRFAGGGVVGMYEPDDALYARDLRLRLAPFQLPLLYTLMSDDDEEFTLPVKGVVTGNVTLTGSTKRGGTVVGDVVHLEDGERSEITGRAFAEFTPVRRYEVDVDVHPLSLRTAGKFMPDAGLRGFASGPVRVSGTMADLRVNTALDVAGGGSVAAEGRFDLSGEPIGYAFNVDAEALDLSAALERAPATSLTLLASGQGRGTDLATMRGTFAADVARSRVDTFAVDSASVRVRLANGLALVDRATVQATGAFAAVQGSFGLTGAHDGDLTYEVTIADLGLLHAYVPGAHPPAGARVRPRPGPTAERLRIAREDSARVARATEIERIVTGRAPPPPVRVDTPRVVPADSLAGSLFLAGRIQGNIRDFDLRGRAAGQSVLVHGFGAERFTSDYVWTNARTSRSRLVFGLSGEDIIARGFQFDTLEARVAYAAPSGEVQLLLRQGAERDYSMRGSFALHQDHNEVHLAGVTMRFDTTTWTLAQPATINWGGPGIFVDHLDLRNQEGGRLYAHGRIPAGSSANLELAVENMNLAHIAQLAQSDVDVRGMLTAKGVMEGTTADPRFRGAFGVTGVSYGSTPVPELRGTFAYANQSLRSSVLALRDTLGAVAATVNAVLPVNLALSGVEGDRLLDRDMSVEVDADSLPLDLLGRVTDAVSDVQGQAAGRVVLRGRLKQPDMAGAIVVRNASARITMTGAHITGINGAVRLINDTITIDSLAGRSGEGTVRLSGGMGIGNWREPEFALHLVADDAEVLKGERGEIHVDAGIDLTGPLSNAYVAGQVTVLHGVLYVPASNDRESISADDPAVFAVLDTSVASDRELMPAESSLLQNLRMDVDIQVNRNTWVRNRDANIEIFSDGLLHVHVEQEALALNGVIATDRGEYRFFSKRFQVKRGSAVFIGGPELNPTLQATAEYEARPPGREAINIQVLIGGTLRRPRIALESDAQPPIPQGDLLSYLAFGRETGSLLELEGTALSAGQGSASLIGVGQDAARRLAAVALGVALDEVEGEAARELGVDVLDITPEELPAGANISDVQSFLLGTRIEAGKYVNPRTFVAVQGSPSTLQPPRADRPRVPPGISIEHRDSKGWRFEASIEPRILLREPTLRTGEPQVNPISNYGVFIFREWRF